MRLHLLGFPHTWTSREHAACAYTQKIVKLVTMMHGHHEIVHYGNEGSRFEEEGVEHVQILSASERAGFYGAWDPGRLYDLQWNRDLPPWRTFNERAIHELGRRVRRGDLILTLAGTCHEPIAWAFPGSASGIATGPLLVEYGIGYYGTFSRYRVYESHAHREWCHGRRESTLYDYDDAVIPNYFDARDFPFMSGFDHRAREVQQLVERVPEEERELLEHLGERLVEPYHLFVGRLVETKGWRLAVEATAELGRPLLLAGQGGDIGPLPPHVHRVGPVTIAQRGVLMAAAELSWAPTLYREPFGGVAVEAQLAGTPCVTTDHGAFTETVEPRFRGADHHELCLAAEQAMRLRPLERLALRRSALERWSLTAVRPLYERYFRRLLARWGAGWYERRSVAELEALVAGSEA